METVNQLLAQRLAESSGRFSIDQFLLTIAIKVISDLSEVREVSYNPGVFDDLIGCTFVSSFSEAKRLYAEHALQQGIHLEEAAEALQAVEGCRFEDMELVSKLITKTPEDGLIRKYHLEALQRYHDALSSFVNLHGDQPLSAFVLNHCAEDIKAVKELGLMTEVQFTEKDMVTVLKSTFNEI